MSPDVLALTGTIAAALIVLAGVAIRSRTDAAQRLIDQLQEERGSVLVRLDHIEHREKIRDDYIQDLRRHITDGLPPPPPPWPPTLYVPHASS